VAFAYVVNRGDGTVSEVDLSTFTVSATLAVSTLPDEPMAIAIDPTNTFAYVLVGGSGVGNEIVKIDLSTFTVAATLVISTTSAPAGIAVDRAGAFAFTVSNLTSGGGGHPIEFKKIDLTSFTVAATLTPGAYGVGTAIATDQAGAKVYATDVTGVLEITVSSFTVTNSLTIAIATNLATIVVDPPGENAYVTDWGTSGGNYRITLSTFAETGTPPNEAVTGGIDIDPADVFGYVSSWAFNTLIKFSIATLGAVGSPLTVTPGDWAVAVDDTGAFAYVTAMAVPFGSGNQIVKVDTGAWTLVGAPLTVGTGPIAIAIWRPPYVPPLNAIVMVL
jgi:DNA-binding beta-propeller fold protein YncE